MEKLNIPIKRWRKKYMILYQTKINNFCINDFFHEYNRKLITLQTYKVEERTFGTPCILFRFEINTNVSRME